MEVELDYSIIASTIPCLKPFMQACNTGWGHVPPQTGDGTAVLKSGGSYGLRSLEKSGTKHAVTSFNNAKEQDERNLRGENCNTVIQSGGRGHQQTDHHGDETSQSIASNDSTQMIIRREVGWTVTYDNETPEENGQPRITHRSDIEAMPSPHAV